MTYLSFPKPMCSLEISLYNTKLMDVPLLAPWILDVYILLPVSDAADIKLDVVSS